MLAVSLRLTIIQVVLVRLATTLNSPLRIRLGRMMFRTLGRNLSVLLLLLPLLCQYLLTKDKELKVTLHLILQFPLE
jgi:hypothetical protein